MSSSPSDSVLDASESIDCLLERILRMLPLFPTEPLVRESASFRGVDFRSDFFDSGSDKDSSAPSKLIRFFDRVLRPGDG